MKLGMTGRLVFSVTLAVLTALGFAVAEGLWSNSAAAERISAKEAREKVKSGEAWLVCGYDSDESFNTMRLEGAIALSAFKAKLAGTEKDQMIIFYCA
jgi:hypothetical protein